MQLLRQIILGLSEAFDLLGLAQSHFSEDLYCLPHSLTDFCMLFIYLCSLVRIIPTSMIKHSNWCSIIPVLIDRLLVVKIPMNKLLTSCLTRMLQERSSHPRLNCGDGRVKSWENLFLLFPTFMDFSCG